RVGDRTTSPTPVGTTIPRASLEEIAVTWPDRKVKGSGASSSRQSAGDGVEQADDGSLDDDDQHDYPEFATEDIKSLNDASQGEHINIIPLQTFDPSIRLDVTPRLKESLYSHGGSEPSVIV
ncbi:hypothetical protein Tco_0717680, partial [Tanacetum coccineum]